MITNANESKFFEYLANFAKEMNNVDEEIMETNSNVVFDLLLNEYYTINELTKPLESNSKQFTKIKQENILSSEWFCKSKLNSLDDSDFTEYKGVKLCSIGKYITENVVCVGIPCYIFKNGIKTSRGDDGEIIISFKNSQDEFKKLFKQQEKKQRRKETIYDFDQNFRIDYETLYGEDGNAWKGTYNNCLIMGKVKNNVKICIKKLSMPIITKQSKKLTNQTLIISTKNIKNKLDGFINNIPIYSQEEINFIEQNSIDNNSIVFLAGSKKDYPSESKQQVKNKLESTFNGIKIYNSVIKENKKVDKDLVNKLTAIIVPTNKNINNYVKMAANKAIPILNLFELDNIQTINNENIQLPFQSTRKKVGITLDTKEIYSRLSHPLFVLINVLKNLYDKFNQDFLNENNLIRLTVIDHGDHCTKNKKKTRIENISILFDISIMKPEAEKICNTYSCWCTCFTPDTQETIDIIHELKGRFFADLISFPILYREKVFIFSLKECTADNGDFCKCTHKTGKDKRDPNCNFSFKQNKTNKQFFDWSSCCKCERENFFKSIEIFLEQLKNNLTWEEALENTKKKGYFHSPPSFALAFLNRIFELFREYSPKDVFKYGVRVLKSILFKTDLLHDCMNSLALLIDSLIKNKWYNEENFEKICFENCSSSINEFYGKNYREFTLNFEKWNTAIKVPILKENYEKMQDILTTWRFIYLIAYQPAKITSQKPIQFYFIAAIFKLYTLFRQLSDDFDIRHTYQHGLFHFADLIQVTTLVNSCCEQGENVNFRYKNAVNNSNNTIQNIFKQFFNNERIAQQLNENNEKEKVEKIQLELISFICKNEFKFDDFKIEMEKTSHFSSFNNFILERFSKEDVASYSYVEKINDKEYFILKSAEINKLITK